MISKDSVIIRQYKNSLKINTGALLTSVVKKEEVKILDVHRDQLRKGQAGDGDMPSYSPGYLNYKQSLPSYFGGGKADYYISGALQDNEYIRISGKNYEIDSRVPYLKDLIENPRYGERTMELNPNSLTLAQEIVTPEFLKLYHTELNK